jgi:hypothetical protein
MDWTEFLRKLPSPNPSSHLKELRKTMINLTAAEIQTERLTEYMSSITFALICSFLAYTFSYT